MKKSIVRFGAVGVVLLFAIGGPRLNLHWSQAGFVESGATSTLTMAALDIGQGDATFITFPTGETMLIDCAKDARILEALGRVMRFYERTIDYVVATHPDLDHYGGCIDVLKRFEVKHILYNGYQKSADQTWQSFKAAVEEERQFGAEYREIDHESNWLIGEVTIHVLYPDHAIALDDRVPPAPPGSKTGTNDTSIVMKISYGNEDILLTGDMEIPLENYLLKKYNQELNAEILKVGHHGSNSSSGEPFLTAVHPLYATISAGLGNTYGHPTARVLKRLERVKAEILRADLLGDILLTITKDTIHVDSNQTHFDFANALRVAFWSE